MLVPQTSNTEATGDLESLIERHRHNVPEVRGAVEKTHEGNEKAHLRHDAGIQRPPASVLAVGGQPRPRPGE